MVYDYEYEYDPSQYGSGDGANTKGHGEAWETLNNQLFEEWRRFNARLEELVERLEERGKQLTASRRAEHVANFRQVLLTRYGTSGVDSRWEGERAKRLDARNNQKSERRGGYAQ